MNRYLALGCLGLGLMVSPLLSGLATSAVPAPKIGVIDIDNTLSSTPAGKRASDAFDKTRKAKQAELDRVIAACLGLYLEATADTYAAAPGDTVKINLEAANRSTVAVRLRRVVIAAAGADDAWEQDLGRLQGRVLVEQHRA